VDGMEYKDLLALREELRQHPKYGKVFLEAEENSLYWTTETQRVRRQNTDLEIRVYNLEKDLRLLKSIKVEDAQKKKDEIKFS
jgi:parvulin-like peptidyl-prolyl isomerase